MEFKVMEHDEVIRCFGGMEMFYPSSGYDESLWVFIPGKRAFPKVLTDFHYLRADRTVLPGRSFGERRRDVLNRKWFVGIVDGQVVGVVAFGTGGVELNEVVNYMDSTNIPYTNAFYMSYCDVKAGLPDSIGADLLEAFLKNFGDGTVLYNSWLGDHEMPIVRKVASRETINFHKCPQREYFGRMKNDYWNAEDFKKNFTSELPNFFIGDTCFNMSEAR